MADWGYQPFESDAGLDYRADVMGGLRSEVAKLLATQKPYVEDFHTILAGMEMFYALALHCGNSLLEAEEVAEWRQSMTRILEVVDDQLSAEAKVGWRTSFFAALDRLAQVAV